MLSSRVRGEPEDTREALLYHLKIGGEMTASELCEAVDVTYMGVKRYLSEFQTRGLVESQIVSKGRGRPFYKYRLTEKARALFPSGYEAVLGDVLDAVHETSGQKGVMELLTLRNKRLINTLYARFEGKEMTEKVAELTRFFAENGYMTHFEALPDGNFLVYQKHCPLHNLALQYRQLCALEPQLMMALLGVRVTRQSHMLKGEPVCGYLVESSHSAGNGSP